MSRDDRKLTRAKLDAASVNGEVPVKIEDGRQGVCVHWGDDWVMIDTWSDQTFECIRVPWGNLLETPIGIVVRLEGAIGDPD